MRTTYNNGPQGLGGWLILPALGLLISPIRMAFDLRDEWRMAMTPEVWDALTNPESPAYHPRWVWLVGAEVLMNAVGVLLTLWVIWKFFTKSSQLPKLFIIWVLLGLFVQASELGFTMSIPALAADLTFPASYKELARSIVSCLIWIPYFLFSRRVSNTFVN